MAAHRAVKAALLFIIFLNIGIDTIQAARILGIFPHFGKSHYVMFEPMMVALTERGHEVVVLTHFPMKNPPPKLKIVDLSKTMNVAYVNAVPINLTPGETFNVLCVVELARMGLLACENVLPSKPVSDLINSSEKFDLIFYEMFNADCFLGFIHRFKAPAIAISSHILMPWGTAPFGLPDNPSYIANHFSAFSDSMTFFERLSNTVLYFTSRIVFSLLADGQNTALARKYFGNDMPPLEDIAKNTSLYFINTHFSLNQVRPHTPNVIELAGLHVRPPGKLDKDLETFLDNAKEGVIYFSLGSTARGATLPVDKRDAFVEAFKGLPQKVLWKWEEDNIPNKPANVKISKWLPQTAVLAHPNVKVFIAHGGFMGMLEAVHYGVPMICIPLFGDQFNNVAMAVKRGFALKLTLEDITYEHVRDVLDAVLKNSSYKEKAKEVSRAFHDRPQSPMETFIYWTEYVIKHKGAPHLQSAAVDLPLMQYLLLDVILVLSVIPIFIVFVSVLIVRCLCQRKKDVVKKPKQKRS